VLGVSIEMKDTGGTINKLLECPRYTGSDAKLLTLVETSGLWPAKKLGDGYVNGPTLLQAPSALLKYAFLLKSSCPMSVWHCQPFPTED